MHEDYEQKRVNKAVGWLISSMVEDGEQYTDQLAVLCIKLVSNLIHHRSDKELRELGWYEVEKIWEIVLDDRS